MSCRTRTAAVCAAVLLALPACSHGATVQRLTQPARALSQQELDAAMLAKGDVEWEVVRRQEAPPDAEPSPETPTCRAYRPDAAMDTRTRAATAVGEDMILQFRVDVYAYAFADEERAKDALRRATTPIRECAEVSTTGSPDTMLAVRPDAMGGRADAEGANVDLVNESAGYTLNLHLTRQGTVVVMALTRSTVRNPMDMAGEVLTKQRAKLLAAQAR